MVIVCGQEWAQLTNEFQCSVATKTVHLYRLLPAASYFNQLTFLFLLILPQIYLLVNFSVCLISSFSYLYSIRTVWLSLYTIKPPFIFSVTPFSQHIPNYNIWNHLEVLVQRSTLHFCPKKQLQLELFPYRHKSFATLKSFP